MRWIENRGMLLTGFVLLFLVAVTPAAIAQDSSVSGQVTDASTGEPLPGVNILVKGTTTGASTDSQGNFELTVESLQDTLVVSYIGYQTKEVPINGRTEISIQLTPQTVIGEEMVVIGYGTAERENVTGSISSIDVTEATEDASITNVGQLFQGRVPGLHATVATEAEGSTGLQVRGQNSINATNSPLIVLDGMTYYGSLSDINPNDIASIDVLKGASAAAVYGASAAAGVIEITTKQGTTAEPTINFNSSVGVATEGYTVRPYGPEEYIMYRRDAAAQQHPNSPDYYYANPQKLPSDITIEEWKALGAGSGSPMEIWLNRVGLIPTEIQNYIEGNTINWHDQVVRDAALRQNYNISVSGQLEKTSYYLSLGYIDNEGDEVGEQFRTMRARLNLQTTVDDWVKVSLHSQYANRDEGYLGANAIHARRVSPLGDKYEEDGSLKWYPHNDGTAINPFLYTKQSGREYEWNHTNLIANLEAELLDLPLGLSYKVRWMNSFDFQRDYLFDPSTVPWGRPAGEASRSEATSYRWQVDNILTWNRTIGSIHSFDATFLFNVEVDNDWNTSASADQFPLEVLGYSELTLGSNLFANSNDTRTTGTALMGRLNYRLLDRYLLTLSYRRDGYSAFGQSNPYAYFPSVAFAWRISDEPFFKVDPISNLKLRLSWGINGNRSIGTYSALQRLESNKYIYGNETVTGISSTNLPNRNLKWEQTEQYNIGIDFGLFEGRFSGMIDAYYMSTTNMLLRRSLPEISGYNYVWSNLGQVVNRGLEASLSSKNVLDEAFSWTSTLNFSLNRNEIKELYGTGENDRENGWFIGHSLHQIYDYEVLGVWQQDESEEAAKYGKKPGDFRLRDVNGDGLLTPIEDKVFQGYTEPRYRISLRNDFQYKNFTVSAMITSWLGDYASHNVHKHVGYTYGRHNQLDYPYWTPRTPTKEWARLASNDRPGFNYWENSSFVKLQNLSVGYQFSDSIVNQFDAKRFRIFLNIRNVYAFSGWDGFDPETHETSPRVLSFGVSLSL